MTNHQRLAALVGSRICHDLISPIGAISNGVELMGMTDGLNNSPEMALIGDSVENANARIRFFRIAFGQASRDQTIGQSELKDIAENLAAGSRLTVRWQVAGDVDRGVARLAFQVLMCLESALPFGGEIIATRSEDRWLLAGVTEKLRIVPEHWDLLQGRGEVDGLPAAAVQFAMVPLAAAELDRPVSVQQSDARIEVTF